MYSYIKLSGACCPICPEYQFDKPIEFRNCPQDIIHLDLDPGRPDALYDPQLLYQDNSGLWRNITLKYTPDVMWYVYCLALVVPVL